MMLKLRQAGVASALALAADRRARKGAARSVVQTPFAFRFRAERLSNPGAGQP
jgi:hypothetical protein